MPKFMQQVKLEYQRRCIVDLLGEDPDFGHNVHILCSALAELGQDVQVDEMVAHANRLAEACLIEFVHRGPPLVLRVTDRGLDVAAGRINVSAVVRSLRSGRAMGCPSTVNRLPENVREALPGWLNDPAITQEEATQRTNALLAEVAPEHPRVSY